jgi:hypothetical protein
LFGGHISAICDKRAKPICAKQQIKKRAMACFQTQSPETVAVRDQDGFATSGEADILF